MPNKDTLIKQAESTQNLINRQIEFIREYEFQAGYNFALEVLDSIASFANDLGNSDLVEQIVFLQKELSGKGLTKISDPRIVNMNEELRA